MAPARYGEAGRTGTASRLSVLPHLDAAHNLARWLVRDASLAEDVVQDGVVRALSYFASFRGGDGRAWLMRIVRNVAYTALAARQPGPLPEDFPDVPDPADNPEATLARQQAVATMEQALAALPIELRECLVLREMEEMSYKDIAHVAGRAGGHRDVATMARAPGPDAHARGRTGPMTSEAARRCGCWCRRMSMANCNPPRPRGSRCIWTNARHARNCRPS